MVNFGFGRTWEFSDIPRNKISYSYAYPECWNVIDPWLITRVPSVPQFLSSLQEQITPMKITAFTSDHLLKLRSRLGLH